jgi:hypothetical protein
MIAENRLGQDRLLQLGIVGSVKVGRLADHRMNKFVADGTLWEAPGVSAEDRGRLEANEKPRLPSRACEWQPG